MWQLGEGYSAGTAGIADEPVLGRLVGAWLAKPQKGGAQSLLGLCRDRLVTKVQIEHRLHGLAAVRDVSGESDQAVGRSEAHV